MIQSNFHAVLDTCVLLPMPLADTLLRFAEEPRFYVPKWSAAILAELERNLVGKWNKSPEQASHRISQMNLAFPDATVRGYESIVEAMQNDENDRHVLACAVLAGASVIVTNNTKHFTPKALEPFGIEAQTPSQFLINAYDLNPAQAMTKLSRQAGAVHLTLESLLSRLGRSAPEFVRYISEENGIWIPCPTQAAGDPGASGTAP